MSCNHYERAFSSLLEREGIRHLRPSDARRPVRDGRKLKSFDFLVDGASEVWVVELKGRKGSPWITRGDLFSLMGWQTTFGPTARVALIFAFRTSPGETPRRLRDLAATCIDTPAGRYHFCLLDLHEVQLLARPRSERWGTCGFGARGFSRAARSLDELLYPRTPQLVAQR